MKALGNRSVSSFLAILVNVSWYGVAIGIVLMACVAVAPLTHFSAAGLRFDARPDFNILAVVHGLIIVVIAEVFSAGTRLDEDQSLTV